MNISIVTIFPEMFLKVFDFGIVRQAKELGLVNIRIEDLRDFSPYSHKQVDDRPYGGGPGMVLMPIPLENAVNSVKNKLTYSDTKVIYLSPKGKKLTQEVAESLCKLENIIVICGRYEGVDQRFIDKYVDEEISIGDYVLSGGEIAAMVLVDTITRLIPGAIKNLEYNTNESFSNPNDRTLLDYPQYTRPEDFNGLKVPDILLSGNHEKIKKWRIEKLVK